MSFTLRPGVWPLVALPLLAGGAGGAAAQTIDTLLVTLQQAEQMALESSPLLRPGQASLELAEAQAHAARRSRILPEVKLRNVWGPAPPARGRFNEAGVLFSPDTMIGLGDLSFFTQLDLTFLQPLYTFGRLGSTIDAAEQQVTLREAELEDTRAEVIFRTRQLYWGVVLTKELSGVSRSVNEQVAEASDRLQELFDDGDASQNDVFKFQMFEYDVASQNRQLEAERTKAIEGLRVLIGVPAGTVLDVATEDLGMPAIDLASLDDYLEMAAANRPDYRQLAAGIAARQALVRSAQAESRPAFFLAGGYSLNLAPGRFDSRNPFVHNPTNFSRPSLVLGMEWNLNFRGVNDRAQIERIELGLLEARSAPLQAQAEQQIRDAYMEVVRARADAEDGEIALRASQNLLRAELLVFDLGTGLIDDVISAFEKNVTMSVTQFRNLERFNSKLAELSRRVGRDIAGS
jgi:outer membrane protein TolC